LNQVCFDETETSEETSVRIAQLSDFYGFNNQPALESYKRRAFISASASPFMRERRSNGRLRCINYRLGCRRPC